ncbi:MAG: S8 family serine peptidase [Planctomycetota bacterium]
MPFNTLIIKAAVAAAIVVTGATQSAKGVESDEKRPVVTMDDLPRHTYVINAEPSELIRGGEDFDQLMAEMKADLTADLETNDIQDATTRRAYLDLLIMIGWLENDHKAIKTFGEQARELEQHPPTKMLMGIVSKAYFEGYAKGGRVGRDEFERVFAETLRGELDALPRDQIESILRTRVMQTRTLDREIVLDSVKTSLDPLAVKAGDEIAMPLASGILQSRFVLEDGIKLAKLAAPVYEAWLADGESIEAADIWQERAAELDAGTSATPVVIAVWDTGIDTSLFEGRLWTNDDEIAGNNIDDDGNGFVDDVHGIAFDIDHRPTTGNLYPLDEMTGDVDQLLHFTAASIDLKSGVDSPRVAELQKHVLGLRGEDRVTFIFDMTLLSNHTHGTHVAGIAAAGNPFARLLPVRETFRVEPKPTHVPTLDEWQRRGEAARDVGAYLRDADARVVNMSWRIGRPAIEAILAATGGEPDAEKRQALSHELFDAFSGGVRDAITNSPDTLFVAGAGNEGNDVDFSEYVPAGLRAPNLVTVGAVDHRGQPTTFTSFGQNVTLYADGYTVNSVVPGGEEIELSGTSMAAPQVANLAGKMLAIDPSLSPEQVIALITEAATPMEGHEGRLLIHPANTLKLVRQRK